MQMPGLWEIALILVVLLVVFGPQKLPEIGKSLGRGLKEFKKAASEFSKEMQDGAKDDDAKE